MEGNTTSYPIITTIEEHLKYGTKAEKEYINLTLKKMIEVELSIVKKEIQNIKNKLKDLEKKNNMSSKEFFNKFTNGELGDKREFIKWYAYKDTLIELEKRHNQLRKHID